MRRAPWSPQKGNNRPGALCRWCGLEVPTRRITFCSDWCVHGWRLRNNPGEGSAAGPGHLCDLPDRQLHGVRGAAALAWTPPAKASGQTEAQAAQAQGSLGCRSYSARSRRSRICAPCTVSATGSCGADFCCLPFPQAGTNSQRWSRWTKWNDSRLDHSTTVFSYSLDWQLP